ncbi:RNA polymerase sigma-70 factor (ECF subfamily) [Actinocorallia herbida]|uniref:RNA polymerase sigma-70 factor (ECF subfamily) n=1 Tax=Actinocorallia herbida TaxID=58109 RepID=A0A3N1D8U7_9ACTN|nr:RNA polymerase sigma factor [Actinocorallia herbida]ROO89964.1 RNA polymerase sigma-70 factor (ECF subfamily) [Actinocorallia herbida]
MSEVATGAGDGELIRLSVDAPERFAEVFDRYARDVHGYVVRRLGPAHADDVVAETFLIAFRRRARYDTSRENARPWLYGIATNLVARHHRAEKRFLRALERTGVDPVAAAFDDGVVDRVAAGAQQRALAGALAGLSRGERDVLLLIAWGGLGYEEVAGTLGIAIGTVRSRLHRGRAKVRAALGGADPTADTDK